MGLKEIWAKPSVRYATYTGLGILAIWGLYKLTKKPEPKAKGYLPKPAPRIAKPLYVSAFKAKPKTPLYVKNLKKQYPNMASEIQKEWNKAVRRLGRNFTYGAAINIFKRTPLVRAAIAPVAPTPAPVSAPASVPKDIVYGKAPEPAAKIFRPSKAQIIGIPMYDSYGKGVDPATVHIITPRDPFPSDMIECEKPGAATDGKMLLLDRTPAEIKTWFERAGKGITFRKIDRKGVDAVIPKNISQYRTLPLPKFVGVSGRVTAYWFKTKYPFGLNTRYVNWARKEGYQFVYNPNADKTAVVFTRPGRPGKVAGLLMPMVDNNFIKLLK